MLMITYNCFYFQDLADISVKLYDYCFCEEHAYTTQNLYVCDKQFPALQSILQSLARRMPQIILMQVEEIFLVVRKAW